METAVQCHPAWARQGRSASQPRELQGRGGRSGRPWQAVKSWD